MIKKPHYLNLTWALIFLAYFIYHVHRAVNRSITHDEALTWHWFVSRGLKTIFDPEAYDPNNHPLHSVLCVFSTNLLGPHHFGLRLPALTGGLLFLLAVFLICRRFPKSSRAGPITMGLLALNPLIFDFISQARGYSLALGFFLFAFWLLLESLARAAENWSILRMWPRLITASLFMGLSVATHPYFAFATSALGLAFIIIAPIAFNRHRRVRDGISGRLFLLTCLPGAILAGLIYSNIHHAMRVVRWNGNGMDTPWRSLRDVMEMNLGLKGIEHGISISRPEIQPCLYAIMTMAGLLVMIALAFTTWRACVLYRSTNPGESSEDSVLSFSGCVFLLGILLHLWAHRIWGISYPLARLAIPLYACFFIWIGLMAGHPSWRKTRLRRLPHVFAANGIVLLLWQTYLIRPMAWYTYEADTRQIAYLLEDWGRKKGKPLRVDADWILAPGLEYYRKTDHLKFLAPVHANGLRGIAPGYEAYVVPDRTTLEDAGLDVSFHAPATGVCVSLQSKN